MDASKVKILIVDDEAPIREVLKSSLMDFGYQISTANDGESGLKAISEFKPDLVFQDIWMPGELDGLRACSSAIPGHGFCDDFRPWNDRDRGKSNEVGRI
jgi:CheY-like chemotaxis protein